MRVVFRYTSLVAVSCQRSRKLPIIKFDLEDNFVRQYEFVTLVASPNGTMVTKLFTSLVYSYLPDPHVYVEMYCCSYGND